MSKIPALLALLLTLGIFQNVEAQTFRNGDTSEESRVVSPVLAQASGVANPQSITCGQFNDDNGDGSPTAADFADCTSLQIEAFPVGSPNPEPAICVLLNSGLENNSPNQFGDGYALTTGPDNIDRDIMGSIRSGTLNGAGFEDLVALVSSDSSFAGPLLTFLNANFTTNSGTDCTDTDPPIGNTSAATWQTANNEEGTLQGDGERGMELFDCDGDGDLDSVVAVSNAADSNYYINVNMNDGSGLQSGPNQFFAVAIGTDDNFPAVLDTGDFNGDSILDVAFASDADDTDSLVICYGDGTADDCSFTCSVQVDLEAVPPGFSADPTSLEAADFDGDGDLDVAIVLLDSDALGYFFNNGSATATGPNFALADRQLIDTLPPQGNSPYAVVSGFFNLDDVPDAAVTNGGPSFFPVSPITFLKFGVSSVPGNVVVINSDGSGGFLPVEPLSLPVSTVAGIPFANPDAIEAKDFDHCGGDDIVALAEGPLVDEVAKYAAFWYNADEPPVVTAVTPLTGAINTPIAVTATCSDPTDDDRSFIWTIAGPAGSVSSITPPNGTLLDTATNIAGSFQGDTVGDYTLTLSCTSCDLSATITVLITLTDVPPPPVVIDTQGGCLASLSGEGGFGKGNQLMWGMIAMLPFIYLLKRFGKKAGIALMALVLIGTASQAQALTTSFSVNTFEPTVDDSEYFTIYNSPTMLKRNFHVGFYLDYAHNTYEFGNANFNRVSGIVNHLLTGNIVGSYAVLDWMSVGLLVPVYFFEGIRSGIPGLGNENNFDIGDIELVLKFRLLNREVHHVGISILPFMYFPTSSGASDFLGYGSFAGGAKLVIDGRIKDRVSIALNIGYLARDRVVDIGGNVLNDQMLMGLGISIDLIRDRLLLITEAQLATVVSDFFTRRTTPAEARVGFRYTWANNHDINVGGGFGLSNGIGSPDFRAFVGYTYTKRPLAEAEVPPPAISEVNVGDELTAQDKIYFDFDKSTIRDISKPTLDKIAGFLKAHPEVTKIRIDGYTCDLGTDAYNLKLSQRRAASAATYLEGQGIDASRVGVVTGYGEANPLVPNKDEPSREQNRRVQIFVEAVQR